MSEAMGLYYLYTIYIEEGLALQQQRLRVLNGKVNYGKSILKKRDKANLHCRAP